MNEKLKWLNSATGMGLIIGKDHHRNTYILSQIRGDKEIRLYETLYEREMNIFLNGMLTALLNSKKLMTL